MSIKTTLSQDFAYFVIVHDWLKMSVRFLYIFILEFQQVSAFFLLCYYFQQILDINSQMHIFGMLLAVMYNLLLNTLTQISAIYFNHHDSRNIFSSPWMNFYFYFQHHRFFCFVLKVKSWMNITMQWWERHEMYITVKCLCERNLLLSFMRYMFCYLDV